MLESNELRRVFRQLYSGCFGWLVIGARGDHRVEGDEELPSRGDKGCFDRLSGGLKPRPKLLECGAPSRGVQGGDVEHRPDDGPAAGNRPWGGALAAVSGNRGETDKRRDATAVELAQLRQFCDQCRRDDGADIRYGTQSAVDDGQFRISGRSKSR